MGVRILIVFAVIGLAETAQPVAPVRQEQSGISPAAENQRMAVQQAMADSIARQRESIRAQAGVARQQSAAVDSFFTIPWPKPASLLAGVTADCAPMSPGEVEELVNENARREGLKPEVLREVMRRESAFRPCAISRAGAQGVMQLMPATAEQFRVSDVFDPRQNTAAGAKFLRSLLDRYGGDLARALGAYNAGPGRVDDAGGVPPIPETQDYVRAILAAVLFQ